LVNHLRSDEPPRHALPNEVWGYLKVQLHAEQTNLVSCTWRFKPDPQNEGLARGWQSPALASDADWKDIRIGAHWESQGYPALDGWAWYRLWVDIPESWKSGDIYLSFEGVDDMYELYVNGTLAGKGGDLATHKDALSEKMSHNITRLVKPGQKALIAVRVDDWVGAGGIFRPVTLGTMGFSPGVAILK
jgi:beta-galactosidase/beta-glucuronidase